jgi:pilus assembly protein CpaC
MSEKIDEAAESAPIPEVSAGEPRAGSVLSTRLREVMSRVEDRVRALSRPRLVLGSAAGLFIAVILATAFSQELTASLRGALPQRIAGNEVVGVQTESGAIRIQLGQSAENRPVRAKSGDRVALTEITGSNAPDVEVVGGGQLDSAGYKPELPEPPTASTIITVPSGQGRLLRFDEAVESVFIADPEVADIRVVSSDLVYVYGKKLGLTNLMAVSARPSGQGQEGGQTRRQQLTASAMLRVVIDNQPSRNAQKNWVPNAPVDVDVFGRRTTVSGHLRNIDEAVDTANIADTFSPKDQPPLNRTTLGGSNQVNIRVRFAEAQRNDLKAFGIDWNFGVKGGNFEFGLVKSGATSEADANLDLGVKAGNFDIGLLIEALQANGSLSILAEPNLTAVTGETASFLAGGEVPIPVPAGNGDAITVQYKPFGVSLSFTPTMVKDNRIALRVKPEVSSIADIVQLSASEKGFQMPAFTVRRAETTVEMASGQTFAMAGLFQRDISRNVEKMPLLGDMPVLGQLFRSERYRRNETELVILITPYLVNPVSDRSLATPLDRAGPSPWQADLVDPSGKGALLTSPAGQGAQSGFILK